MAKKNDLNKQALPQDDDLIQDSNNEPNDADVSDEERELLEEASTTDPSYTEEIRMHQGKVDMLDDDGEPLNEDDELDVPGAELDDDEEAIGDEDEENNEYSTDKNDDDE
ncbi:hypothetical protein LX64_01586 [Chitinophaga skermanii]|uniref:Uncharacterized protein n=1 Tax=Chitinophaga skermanii TaxID=331697 RepID=A0A327QPE9_9BACT|nr:hypothetical protein [Chitinophaga skermanii]RAJ06459.1 hypothetical protein LX64_01586 [Chitinophaga skermanii]